MFTSGHGHESSESPYEAISRAVSDAVRLGVREALRSSSGSASVDQAGGSQAQG